MPSIRTLLRFGSSRDFATDQGLAGAGGGFFPVVSVDDLSVTVVVPVGVLISSFLVVEVSSEQPENPMQRPMATTPIIVTLISFLMRCSLDLGDATAGDLT